MNTIFIIFIIYEVFETNFVASCKAIDFALFCINTQNKGRRGFFKSVYPF